VNDYQKDVVYAQLELSRRYLEQHIRERDRTYDELCRLEESITTQRQWIARLEEDLDGFVPTPEGAMRRP